MEVGAVLGSCIGKDYGTAVTQEAQMKWGIRI
jgi:hypothetical protein